MLQQRKGSSNLRAKAHLCCEHHNRGNSLGMPSVYSHSHKQTRACISSIWYHFSGAPIVAGVSFAWTVVISCMRGALDQKRPAADEDEAIMMESTAANAGSAPPSVGRSSIALQPIFNASETRCVAGALNARNASGEWHPYACPIQAWEASVVGFALLVGAHSVYFESAALAPAVSQ